MLESESSLKHDGPAARVGGLRQARIGAQLGAAWPGEARRGRARQGKATKVPAAGMTQAPYSGRPPSGRLMDQGELFTGDSLWRSDGVLPSGGTFICWVVCEL